MINEWSKKASSSKLFEFIFQLIKFGLVGISNVLLDLAVYFVLTRFLHFYYLLAATISFIIFVTWSFYANRKWTFAKQIKNQKITSQYIKFFSANLLAIILNLAALYFFVDCLHIYDMVGKVMASVIVGLVNFCLNKFWTFGNFKKIES